MYQFWWLVLDLFNKTINFSTPPPLSNPSYWTMQQPASPPYRPNTTSSLSNRRFMGESLKCKDATTQTMAKDTQNVVAKCSASSSTTFPAPFPDKEDNSYNATSEEESSVRFDCSCRNLEWCGQQAASAALRTLIQDAALTLLCPPRPGFPLLVVDMDRTLMDGTPIGNVNEREKLPFVHSFIFFNPLGLPLSFEPSLFFCRSIIPPLSPSLPPSLPLRRPPHGLASARPRVSVARAPVLGSLLVDEDRLGVGATQT